MDTESASASTASAVDLFGEYDVFLSFCSKDTRYGFTDFLYTHLNGAGIRTFRDDDELGAGEEIGPDLLKAIKGSKILIPVFSKSYAFSKWCLLELAQMVECRANGGHKIFPIFYDVDPSEVQHQSGSYEEAFRQYRGKKRLDEKTVQGWEKALTKVGGLKGYELKKETGGREGELVKIIVEKVLNFLKNCNYESKNLVGMDNHMKKMKELLNFNFNGVRFIGIHGMGGLGKTTIAQTIYNQFCELFECHCFLEDVREISKSRNGMVHLQNQLLSKILKTKISTIDGNSEGIKKIKGAVRGKKVFIVLDDVDEKSQIDKLARSHRWFGAQSRIIITTRNEEVLRALEQTCHIEGHPEVYRNYKPELMDNDHSLQLFSKYAFMSDSPPEGYGIISKEIVSIAAGLPLVLVTIGSSLFCEMDISLWEEKLRKLKEIPEKEVLEKLRLSFDPLDNGQKQIFLDIACFFIGEDKRNPCYMWDDCKFYPRDGLNVLVRRSLITVGDDNILRMHDQLRDLGRQIVCEGNWNEPGRWSRVWRNDDALAIIETRQGTKNVKALSLDFGSTAFLEPACPVGKDFRKLQNLRYLNLNYVDLNGDFEHCLSNLRWLRWNTGTNNPKPRNLHMKNLLILDIEGWEITDDWEGWSQIKMSRKLKVLDLSHCYSLCRAPYLSTFWTLERLSVNQCESLCSLDGIEELESLRYLNASSCGDLKELPNLSKLKKLEELHIEECGSLERLLSLSSLKKLRTLEASRCFRLIEIQGLDEVDSLEFLDISDCESLKRLPNLSNLKKLKKLDASSCIKLTEILGLSELESLELLDIGRNDCIERLSDDLSKLKKLRELKTSSCPKLREIPGLEGLESLEHLDMSGCISLERLPNLPNLGMLKDIHVSSCDKLYDVEGLRTVESLEHLDMSDCISIERLPNLPNLGMLKDIQLHSCHKLHDVEGLRTVESLESLKLSFCKALEMLDLTNLKNLKNLEINFLSELKEIRRLEELKFLEGLHMAWCTSIEKLPDFSNLGKLEVIIASYCEKLTEIRGLENLESLTDLYISGCKSLQYLPHLPNTTIYMDF